MLWDYCWKKTHFHFGISARIRAWGVYAFASWARQVIVGQKIKFIKLKTQKKNIFTEIHYFFMIQQYLM